MAQVIAACFCAIFGLVAFEKHTFPINNMCGLTPEIGVGQFLEFLEADVTN